MSLSRGIAATVYYSNKGRKSQCASHNGARRLIGIDFFKIPLTKTNGCCIIIGLTRHRPISRVWRSTQAGRRGAPAKGVGRVTGARVRISPSPPEKKDTVRCPFFLLRDSNAIAGYGARGTNASARSGSDLACAERLRDGRSLSRNNASDARIAR